MGNKLSARKTSRSLHENLVREHAKPKLTERYEMKDEVGKGSMGSISRVVKRSTKEEYAMKTLIVGHMSRALRKELVNEIEILKSLDHPHIIRCYETFQERRRICLILELCTGGDMYGRRYNEAFTIRCVRQICSAVAYLHSKGVCHRDLKFENILFESEDPDSGIKIIDFGLSKRFSNKKFMTKACGTVYSMAPEVIRGEYTEACDLWSIGVMTYMMLCGELPFSSRNEDALIEDILACRYSFSHENWTRVSPLAKDFVSHLLKVNPKSRWTARKCLESEWLNSCLVGKELQLDGILTAIKSFGQHSKLKRAALMVVAYHCNPRALVSLRDSFLSIDKANDGYITYEELRDVLKSQDIQDDELEEIFRNVDQDQSGKIHYLEFLAATVEAMGLAKEEKLLEAFDRLDEDDTGYISKKNLKKLLGSGYQDSIIEQMIRDTDKEGNGQIDYQEFLELFTMHQKEAFPTACGNPP